jgi:hypothetical protein
LKKLLLTAAFVLAMAGAAWAGDNVSPIFYNQTGTGSIAYPVGNMGIASVQVPTFSNHSSAYDISVSADGGKNYVVFDTYSSGLGGITDIPTNAPTHVKVTHRQKKKVHPWPAAAATINTK